MKVTMLWHQLIVLAFSCLSWAQDNGLRGCDEGEVCYRNCRDYELYKDRYRRQTFCCLSSRECYAPRFDRNQRCYCYREKDSSRSHLTGSNNEIVSPRQELAYSNIMDTFIQGTSRLEKAMEMLQTEIESLDFRLRRLEGTEIDREPISSTNDRDGDDYKPPDYGNNDRFSCPSGFASISSGNEVGPTCWYFSKNSLTWSEARQDCSSRIQGAELAFFGPKQEYDDLLRYLDDNYSFGDDYWINSMRDIEKGWIWRSSKIEDGIFRMWSSWDRGDSSTDALRTPTPAGSCLVMKSEQTPLRLQPAECEKRKRFICRYRSL